MIKPLLPDDVDLETAYGMLIEFLGGISHLFMIFDPETSKLMDDYCRGMVFGLHGSSMLVNIAKVNRNIDYSQVDFLPSKDGKRVVKKRKSKGKKNTID